MASSVYNIISKNWKGIKMYCCEKFEKLLETGHIFKADKNYLLYTSKGTDKQVLTMRFCPFCGEGEISPLDQIFWQELEGYGRS